MIHTMTFSLLVALAAGGPVARIDRAASGPPDVAHIPHCLVSLIEDREVPAEESGRLLQVFVQEGEMVQRDALLAQIDDRQPQLDKFAAEMNRDAALARASDDIEVKYAEASFDVADAELVQKEQINANSPGSIPVTEIRRLRLTRRRAELQIEKSKLDLRVAKMTADVEQAAVTAADNNIQRRKIPSPIGGMVVEIKHHTGEWVNAGDTVARVVRIDQLRVEGFLSVKEFDPAEVDGKLVTVEVELARGRREQFHGRIVFVNPLVLSGDKYRVRAEVENRLERNHWLLQPGTAASMSIHLR
ncbi:MAG: HlyD family efflux transporter periplasmic adaptor subunit [Pirellulaceae bacterium]